MKLRQFRMSQFRVHHAFGYHADGFAAACQDRIGKNLHQANVTSSINEAPTSLGHDFSQTASACRVDFLVSRFGSAKNAKPATEFFHDRQTSTTPSFIPLPQMLTYKEEKNPCVTRGYAVSRPPVSLAIFDS
jgi:hypothetical protein